MSVLFKTRLIIQNQERVLILACADEKGGIQYGFLERDIKDTDNIKSEISELVHNGIHAKTKSCEFFSKSSSVNTEGETVITLYYLCEIGVDVLKLSQDYDSYYWLNIDDIIAQPVLPSWIKGAVLLLSQKLKQKQQAQNNNIKFISEFLTLSGAKESKRQNSSIHFSKQGKTFCIIDKDWIQLLYDDSFKPDFEHKIVSKKGVKWLLIPKSIQNADLKQPLISAFNLI